MPRTPEVSIVRRNIDGTYDIKVLPESMMRCEECGSFEFMTLVTECTGPAPHMQRDHVVVVPEGYFPPHSATAGDEPPPTKGNYSMQKGAADGARGERGPSFKFTGDTPESV